MWAYINLFWFFQNKNSITERTSVRYTHTKPQKRFKNLSYEIVIK